MPAGRHKSPRPPLDPEKLERLALHYVGRYATTRAKLGAYLARKVRERGWKGHGSPDVGAIAERLAALGYVDDAGFATTKADALTRRGFGVRRIGEALRMAGIAESDAAPIRAEAKEHALAAGLRFARRKRIGPYAAGEPGPAGRQKAFAAMMRAGHPIEIVRLVLAISPEEIPERDIGEG